MKYQLFYNKIPGSLENFIYVRQSAYSSFIFRQRNLQNNDTKKLTTAPVAAIITVFIISVGLRLYNKTRNVPAIVQDNVLLSG